MKSQPKTLPKTGLPIHWITELFKVFQARYFAKWTAPLEGIQDRAVQEWSNGLSGLTGEQLKQGIDKWDSDWPPTLSEFKTCCIGIKEDWKHSTAAYKVIDNSKALPILKAQKKVRDKSMDEIKKSLGLK